MAIARGLAHRGGILDNPKNPNALLSIFLPSCKPPLTRLSFVRFVVKPSGKADGDGTLDGGLHLVQAHVLRSVMSAEPPMPPNAGDDLRPALLLEPHQPLWQRLPRRDANGRRLADFMMLIPGLRQRPRAELHARARAIERVLNGYGSEIAFVELNLKLNTLWVSLTARPGVCSELPCAIQAVVPEALLVGPKLSSSR